MMIELFIYKRYTVPIEKLKKAKNLNLLGKPCWKCEARRLISAEQLASRKIFEEKVLPAIRDQLEDEDFEEGDEFDIKRQDERGYFKSLMGGNYLVL